MGENLAKNFVAFALLFFNLGKQSLGSQTSGDENFAWRKIAGHEAARLFLLLTPAASLLATLVFFSRIGSGLFRVR